MQPPTADRAAAAGIFRGRAVWPIGLAVALRLAIWAVVPSSRFASDEDSYYLAAIHLLNTGARDLFWPPVTGWLIAAIAWMLGTTAVPWIRLAWVMMDVACLLALRVLADRLAARVFAGDRARADRFVLLVAIGYAVYLPAISFAEFATSETPALLQTLLVLVIVTRPALSLLSSAVAGTLLGTLVLTRPSLLPVAVLVPAALVWAQPRAIWLRHAAIMTIAAALVVCGLVVSNWRQVGELTIARNSAYNLYIGNRELYAEDLNLFSPRATPEQITFRRQYFSGTLAYPTESPAQLQRQAIAAIRERPALFLRRALGRLARVFAPKTDVLELVGGEQRAGIFAPASLTLLAVANLQWTAVLFGGLIGLARLWRTDRPHGALLLSVLVGSLPLCLVAISKPRYAFVFEPILLLGAAAWAAAPRAALDGLRPFERWTVGLIAAFILWGWAAWLIFAVTSRQALATVA